MLEKLFLALALMVVIEGIFPFVNPSAYKKFLMQFSQIDDKTLRRIGLSMMIAGTLLIYIL